MIEAASTGSLGEVCVNTEGFKSLPAGVALDPRRYDTARQKVDMTAMVLRNLGAAEAMRRNGESEPRLENTNFGSSYMEQSALVSIRRGTVKYFTRALFNL